MNTHGLKCLTCGTTIVSRHPHDFVPCDCPPNDDHRVWVDGGSDYMRIGAGDLAEFDMVEVP